MCSPPRTGARSSRLVLRRGCRRQGRRDCRDHSGCWLGRTGLQGHRDVRVRPAQAPSRDAQLGTCQAFPPGILLLLWSSPSSSCDFHPSRHSGPKLRRHSRPSPLHSLDNQSVSKSCELHIQNLSLSPLTTVPTLMLSTPVASCLITFGPILPPSIPPGWSHPAPTVFLTGSQRDPVNI